MTKVAEICKFQSGGTPSKSNTDFYGGQIPWITTVSLNGGYIDETNAIDWITDDAIKNSAAKIVPQNSILIGTRVGIGKTAINRVAISTSQDVIALIDIDERVWNKQFLCLFFLSQRDYLLSQARGATIKGIKIETISNLVLPSYSIGKQSEIVATLFNLKSIITHRKQQLSKLDELVKARFVEMFGDPVTNPHNFEKKPLSEFAEIKIGPFGSLLHKEDYIEKAHALVNPSHISEGKIAVDLKLTVSDEKYEELSAYHLFVDDVVMGRRGEMGRCAVVSENGLLCGTGSMIIRSNGILKADFIQKIISFPSVKKTIEDMAVGQTMPNLNVPIVSNFMIICPPLEVQEQYYSFAEQIDKSKVVVQKALDEAQLLFDSLMQEYFE